jgi:hypothetical protein
MNKLKNIGISALAGTLVSLSAAQAGGVSVTGSWELSYSNLDHEKTTGSKLGMNKNISFSASGDVSDGGAVTWATSVNGSDAMGLTSADMSINMGGIATLAYDSGTGGYGANAIDNIVPTAWEEVDHGFSTGITDVGVVSKSKGVINLTVRAPVAGTGISLSYVSRVSGGHIADGGSTGDTGGSTGLDAVLDLVNYNSPHFGFRWGFAGEVELKETTCKAHSQSGSDHSCAVAGSAAGVGGVGHKGNPYGATSFSTLKLGPLSLGAQATFKDPQDLANTGIKNKRSIVAGAAFLVGDTFSISYGRAWDKYRYNDDFIAKTNLGPTEGETEYQMIEFRGWSAAVNLGPVALKGTKNNVSNAGENAQSAPRSHSEINLSIAF